MVSLTKQNITTIQSCCHKGVNQYLSDPRQKSPKSDCFAQMIKCSLGDFFDMVIKRKSRMETNSNHPNSRILRNQLMRGTVKWQHRDLYVGNPVTFCFVRS